MTDEDVTNWRLVAEADGWNFAPTYRHEPVEHAFRGQRDGFVIQGIARPQFPKAASLTIWGPDGMQIKIPASYSMNAIRSAVRRCLKCGATDVDTYRASFAGRYCETCLPTAKRELEYPGWTN